MKKLLLLLIIPLLFSCGNKNSKKGDWNSSDKKKCKSDIISKIKNSHWEPYITTALNTTENEVASCFCKQGESLYNSFEALETAGKNESDMVISAIMMDCIGDVDKLMDIYMEL